MSERVAREYADTVMWVTNGVAQPISSLSDEGLQRIGWWAAQSRSISRAVGLIALAVGEEMRLRGLKPSHSYYATECSVLGCEKKPLYRVGKFAYCRAHHASASERRLDACRELNKQSALYEAQRHATDKEQRRRDVEHKWHRDRRGHRGK